MPLKFVYTTFTVLMRHSQRVFDGDLTTKEQLSFKIFQRRVEEESLENSFLEYQKMKKRLHLFLHSHRVLNSKSDSYKEQIVFVG